MSHDRLDNVDTLFTSEMGCEGKRKAMRVN